VYGIADAASVDATIAEITATRRIHVVLADDSNG
jgi:hypothetical protein